MDRGCFSHTVPLKTWFMNSEVIANLFWSTGSCISTRNVQIKVNSNVPCRSLAVLIYTCHVATLPFSDSAVSFVKVRVVDGNIRTASLFLVTTFVELSMVAGRSRTQAGRPYAVSGRPMLICTYHAVSIPLSCRAVPWLWEVAFRTTWSWHGKGMAWYLWISFTRAVRLRWISDVTFCYTGGKYLQPRRLSVMQVGLLDNSSFKRAMSSGHNNSLRLVTRNPSQCASTPFAL
jgi:hypothetical protein